MRAGFLLYNDVILYKMYFYYIATSAKFYCFRKLRSFNIDNTILSMFYKSCIQSVLTFCFICWFGNVRQKDKNKLQRVAKILRKAKDIINDSTHILYNDYVLLPSSRRFRTIISKTNRKRDSFMPMSGQLLNSER